MSIMVLIFALYAIASIVAGLILIAATVSNGESQRRQDARRREIPRVVTLNGEKVGENDIP